MDAYQKAILTKLTKEHCISAKHILKTNLLKGFPKHAYSEMEKALDKLVKQNYVVKHPTAHGWAYAINHNRIGEIQALLESP
jgi:hypothetical protein